jgi:hypothetical protein
MNPSTTAVAARCLGKDPGKGLFRLGLAGLVCVITIWSRADAADTQVYECNQDGTVTFSQTPCTGQEQKVDIQYDQSGQTGQVPTDAAASSAPTFIEDRQADAVAEANLLDNQILQTEQQITRLQIEREAQVAALKQRLFTGTEDRDVTAWKMKLDQEIESVYQNYSARIVSENAKLDSLRARRAALIGDQAAPQ